MREATARRTALVTGGASGIGLAVSEALVANGVRVVILSLPGPGHDDEVKHFASRAAADQATRKLRSVDCEVHVVEGDAAEPDAVEAAVRIAEELGGVDVLVCNAATNCVHPVVGHDVDLWRRVLEVNLVGPFLAIRACLPGMLRRGYGRIVSIASVAASVGMAGYSAYCASKHGLLGLHRAVACEVDGQDITVNTVSPGFVDTPSAHLHLRRSAEEAGKTYEEALAEVIASAPQRRLVSPAEVAAVVAFVCGPEGRLIHAADIPVDAGWNDKLRR